MWGTEAIMLSAGTNIEWLRDDLGLIDTSEQSHDLAQSVPDADGVVYVPALLGLGTPQWDYGARGSFFGITRGTTRAHLVRAVLEGVAQRGADLVRAAEGDTGLAIETVRVDGGMSQNPTFVQALADADEPTGRGLPHDRSHDSWCRVPGRGRDRHLRIDDRRRGRVAARRPWSSPAGSFDAERWTDAVARTAAWIPELSALEFS